VSGAPYGRAASTTRRVGFSLPRRPRAPANIGGMSSHVLLVDDDDGFRALARRMLEALGLVVVAEAGTVAAAMSAAHALEPSAALVDVDLPDGNGVALAHALVALPFGPRVVLTSADPDAARCDDVRRSGSCAFVAKADLPNAPLVALLAAA
jgi:DNA-binding NarL/FixJ family response regulator